VTNRITYPLAGGDYTRVGNDLRQVDGSTKPNPGKSAKARQAAEAADQAKQSPATGKPDQAK
jgi:hypothetical protein